MRLILCLIGLSIVTLTYSQEVSRHTLGVRSNYSGGLGVGLTYQYDLGQNGRLEVNSSIQERELHDGFKIAAMYQYIRKIAKKINWYAGGGAGMATVKVENQYNPNTSRNTTIDNSFSDEFFLITGDVGLEYHPRLPFMVSLDMRPAIGFGDYREGLVDIEYGLAIRYKF